MQSKNRGVGLPGLAQELVRFRFRFLMAAFAFSTGFPTRSLTRRSCFEDKRGGEASSRRRLGRLGWSRFFGTVVVSDKLPERLGAVARQVGFQSRLPGLPQLCNSLFGESQLVVTFYEFRQRCEERPAIKFPRVVEIGPKHDGFIAR